MAGVFKHSRPDGIRDAEGCVEGGNVVCFVAGRTVVVVGLNVGAAVDLLLPSVGFGEPPEHDHLLKLNVFSRSNVLPRNLQ